MFISSLFFRWKTSHLRRPHLSLMYLPQPQLLPQPEPLALPLRQQQPQAQPASSPLG